MIHSDIWRFISDTTAFGLKRLGVMGTS